MCSSSGLIHNFDVYSGRIAPPQNGPDLGSSSNIVLTLSEVIPNNVNHLLYFDNWFTFIPLELELWKRRIFGLGTARSNRLKGCTMMTDKEMKSKARGTYDEKECKIDGAVFWAVKWYDAKSVTLLTTFDSAEPTNSVKRYDRSSKTQVVASRPKLVETHSKFMGEVDLLNSLVGLDRIKIRSKKYYHRLFFHFVDVTVVTCWLMYRRDCNSFGVPQNKQIPLMDFKNFIALALEKEGQVISPKRGRPSLSVESVHEAKRQKGHNTKPIPQQSVRQDNIDHYPIYMEKRGRCRLPGCKSAPHLLCHKCNTYLCIDKSKNCFLKFHKE